MMHQAQTDSVAPLALELDHVIIKSSRAEELFRFFRDMLMFPVSSDYKVIVPGVFSSGTVSVGNVHLECAQVGLGSDFTIPEDGQAPYGGLCMDADRQFGEMELQRRGLKYEVLAPLAPDGKPMFTNLKIGGLTTVDQQFSLTYYRETFDPIERKRRMMHELRQRSGGPLGVLGAADIILGASNHEESEMIWTRILGNPVTPHQWKLTADDPTLWLVPAEHIHRLIGITLRVTSIQSAKNYLHEQSALAFDSDGAPCIKPSGTEGLVIKLIDVPKCDSEVLIDRL